ncbi:conserved Plasmodium protein, unknown function [Plasmodium gallinaceum]|uniref:Uncharacterized protein n=1 Tax=Plasmodium gallinaceum TaxID=5849 RepID=A0A1J1GMB6_PLAGA|nr:conserved Plasmodium protein, unknown function [Plasmodium gallinaceum]CRG93475.1 conserved Plasmodium protein, unknown function [Plasmodium gallinaceum]
MLNKILNDILENWEKKEFSLSSLCLCFHHLKKKLSNVEDKKDFFINDIKYATFKKLSNLIEDQNINNNDNKYFYLIFTTFIFNLECEFIADKSFLFKHMEYCLNELDIYINKKTKQNESKNNKLDILHKKDDIKGKSKNILNKEKEDKKNVNMKNSDENKITEDTNYLNFFEKIDILMKNVIDLKINSNDDNKFINYKIYTFHSITKFIFFLSQNEKISKFFFKHIKNILISIINVNLTTLYDENIVNMANKIIFFLVDINFHFIKDYEKEFFNFLYIQLNKNDSIEIIKEIFVLYLKKKNNIILNNEIYKEMNNYANENINLFLKYGYKENLYFFLNSINIFKKLVNFRISNTDNNIYIIKSMEYININLSIKDIVLGINKLLEYLVNISKNYLNNEKMNIYLNDNNCIYDKKEKKNMYNIENILRTINEEKKYIYVNNFNVDKNNNYNTNNIFRYITDNIFDFFREIIVHLDSEIISINANQFVNFMKFFFVCNNENDLFLSYFLNNNIYIYSKDLLKKCFAIFDEFVNYIVYLFRIINVLTQNKLLIEEDLKENIKEEDKKLFNVLNKIKEIIRCDNITDIYYNLYNNNAKALCLYLKYLAHYTNESVKEKILIHYEHFFFYIFNRRNNANFNMIFKNNISFYLTLKMLYTFVKIKNCNFENVYNIYFKLSKLEKELNINEECSFFYKNKMYNNICFIQKIKMFLLKNLDSITYDKKIYINKKEKFTKLEKKLGKINETDKSLLKKKKENRKFNDEINVYDKRRFKTTHTDNEILNKEINSESDEMNESSFESNDDEEISADTDNSEHLEKKNKNKNKIYVNEYKECNNKEDIYSENEEKKMNNEKENKKVITTNKEKKNAKISIQNKCNKKISKGKNNITIKKERKINNKNLLNKQDKKDVTINGHIVDNLKNNPSIKSTIVNNIKLKNKKRKKEQLINSYQCNNSDKNTINLNELKDNIKIVSSFDAVNSLNYMKQSILSEL